MAQHPKKLVNITTIEIVTNFLKDADPENANFCKEIENEYKKLGRIPKEILQKLIVTEVNGKNIWTELVIFECYNLLLIIFAKLGYEDLPRIIQRSLGNDLDFLSFMNKRYFEKNLNKIKQLPYSIKIQVIHDLIKRKNNLVLELFLKMMSNQYQNFHVDMYDSYDLYLEEFLYNAISCDNIKAIKILLKYGSKLSPYHCDAATSDKMRRFICPKGKRPLLWGLIHYG